MNIVKYIITCYASICAKTLCLDARLQVYISTCCCCCCFAAVDVLLPEREPTLRSGLCYRKPVWLSSVCLSVTFVRPTQGVETFRQYFFTILYLSHPLTSVQNLQRLSQRNPSVGALKQEGNKMSRSGISSPDEYCFSWVLFVIVCIISSTCYITEDLLIPNVPLAVIPQIVQLCSCGNVFDHVCLSVLFVL